MTAMFQPAEPASVASVPTRSRVLAMRPEAGSLCCSLADGKQVRLPAYLGSFLHSGGDLEFAGAAAVLDQFRVILNAPIPQDRELLFVPIGCATQPKPSRQGEHVLRAAVVAPSLGIDSIILAASAVREYFYRSRTSGSLYARLGISPTASPAELRLAYRLTALELQAEAHAAARRDSERAFNILAQPELRICHDAVSDDPEQPALFPYGGFGTILVQGERSSDGRSFFAHRILSFLPNLRQRRFRAAFRRIEFFDGHALYRDSRRKAEIWLDPGSLPLVWDSSWNQWKHLAGLKFGIEAAFVQTGKYRFRSGEWRLVTWDTALPSRTKITWPPNAVELIAKAQRTYQRFGRYFDALLPLQARIAREPVECAEIEEVLGRLGIPGDFDPKMLAWKPDYEECFYAELSKRARSVYSFRGEYIFEWGRAMVAEIPETGHATYLFRRPPDLDNWIRTYAQFTREDVRRNRGNAAEALGFLGRVMHGRNPRSWLKELRFRAGENIDAAGVFDAPSGAS